MSLPSHSWQAGWYGVFAAECFAWFCVGEIVARGGLIDYN
jgi:hypothetical protein